MCVENRRICPDGTHGVLMDALANRIIGKADSVYVKDEPCPLTDGLEMNESDDQRLWFDGKKQRMG